MEVTNECTTTPLKSQEVTLNVTPNPASFTPNTSGNYKLTGKDCYDVAQDNFNTTCGTQANRPGDFLDGSRNWVENRTFTYTFTATGAYTELQFITDDPNVLLKTTNKPTGTTFTLTFDKAVLDKAKGKDKASALKLTVYALFKDAGGNNSRLEVNIKVQDCMCGCGAYTAKNTWKVFMCHNLGADMTSNPFTPSKELNGDYYQYGQKEIGYYGPNAATPNRINVWQKTISYITWSTSKTSYDPCPEGYRVPSIGELTGIASNNTVTNVGSWGSSTTNFSSGKKFGNDLFLPASGSVDPSQKSVDMRGLYGRYWSTDSGTVSTSAYFLEISSGKVEARQLNKAYGFSVRCIKQ